MRIKKLSKIIDKTGGLLPGKTNDMLEFEISSNIIPALELAGYTRDKYHLAPNMIGTDDDNWTRTKRYSIVKNVFSTEQKLSGSELLTILIINATTGKVDEVYFEFHNQDPYKIIPVSVFREIEVEIKKNIWYTPTAEGRKLNYILRWWDQDPSEPI